MSKRSSNELNANIRKFSACDDPEEAIETSGEKGGQSGACTLAFLEASLHEYLSPPTFIDILKCMTKKMKDQNLAQRPVFSYSLKEKNPSDQLFSIAPLIKQPSDRKRKIRAVLIGINYTGIPHIQELKGSHRDVFAVEDYLIRCHGFTKQDILILMDDGIHKSPTSENIYEALIGLTHELEDGDCAFVHFSGHAIQVEDNDNDEVDKLDEVLVPIDTENGILDDYLYEYFLRELQEGVTMTCLIDCCHSGSLFDLPYQVKVSPNESTSNKIPNNLTTRGLSKKRGFCWTPSICE